MRNTVILRYWVLWLTLCFPALDALGQMEVQCTYGEKTRPDVPNAIQPLPDGAYVTAGQSGGRAYLTKTTHTGQLLWTRSWAGAVFNGLAVDAATATLYTAGTYRNSFPTRAWLAAWDSAGNNLWSKNLGEGDAADVAIGSDGKLYAISSQDKVLRLHCLDHAGNTQWNSSVRWDPGIEAKAMGQTVDGKWVVLAQGPTIPDNLDDALLFWFGPDGQLDTARGFGGPGIDVPSDILTENSIAVAVVGSTQSFNARGWPDDWDGFMTRISEEDLIFTNFCYSSVWRGPNDSLWVAYPDYIRQAVFSKTHDILTIGTQDQFEGYFDFMCLRLKEWSGDALKAHTLGGYDAEHGTCIAKMSADSIVVAGTVASKNSGNGDIFMVSTHDYLTATPCFQDPVPSKMEWRDVTQLSYNLLLTASSTLDNTPATDLTLSELPTQPQSRAYNVSLKAAATPPSCPGLLDGKVTLHGSGYGPFAYYVGDTSITYLFPKQSDSLFLNLKPGLYTIAITDAMGCGAKGTVTVPPRLDFHLFQTQPTLRLCPGEAAAIHLASDGGEHPLTYRWPDGRTITGDTAVFENVFPGDYVAQLVDSNGCKRELPVKVEAGPNPKAGGPDTVYKPLSPTQDQLRNLRPATPNGGIWSGSLVSDGNAGILNLALAPDTGLYTVTYTVERCSANREIVVRALKGVPLLPSAFTPNGDGLDDTFSFFIPLHNAFSLDIQDRWGHPCFHSDRMEDSWDGRDSNGHQAPAGIYVFQLKARLASGEELDRTGTVTLLR